MTIFQMLHGTSSAFFDSIKQKGLIPDSENKVWADHSKATYENPSCKSLYGIYLTNNIFTAYTAAKTAIDKYPGNVLLVSAQIDSTTALADEDNIWCWVETWLEKTFDKFGYSQEEADKFLGFIESQSSQVVNHCLKWFAEKLHKELTVSSNEIDYDVMREVFYYSLMRRCTHLYHTNKRLFYINYQSNHKLFKLPSSIKSVEDAENEYLQAIDKLTVQYKDSCIKSTNLHTLRIPTSIGFYGKNLIQGMMVINDYEVKNTWGNVKFIKDKLSQYKNFALCGL